MVRKNKDQRAHMMIDTDILTHILESGGDGITQTMYKCNLSYTRVKECVTILAQSGLLVWDEKTVHITGKGIKCVILWKEAMDDYKMNSGHMKVS